MTLEYKKECKNYLAHNEKYSSRLQENLQIIGIQLENIETAGKKCSI